jgi:hypothetical protein
VNKPGGPDKSDNLASTVDFATIDAILPLLGNRGRSAFRFEGYLPFSQIHQQIDFLSLGNIFVLSLPDDIK